MKTSMVLFASLFLLINVAYTQSDHFKNKSISADIDVTQNVNTLNLTITALIEGFYSAQGSSMTIGPMVKVELHDAISKEGIESRIGTLNTLGVGTFSFSNVVNGIPYYIVIKSSNTIETWCSSAQNFSSGTLSYNFTTAAEMAYANNMIKIGSKWCIYSGDVNQDGYVDSGDLLPIDNDYTNYLYGLGLVTDVNGDGYVDSGDLLIVDNNYTNYIYATKPNVAPDTIMYSGQTYHTILIGTQWWIKENLNVGTRINGYIPQSNNGIIEKYCYNDDQANCAKYGGLYQWSEIMKYTTTEGSQGICPSGWHIPTNSEITTLNLSIGSDGNLLKSGGQGNGAGSGTNISEFSAILAGSSGSDGSFSDLANYSYIWSSTQYNSSLSHIMTLDQVDNNIGQGQSNKSNGFSVRCLKN
jgi:uncharacterized protein (TIGR02145 family)